MKPAPTPAGVHVAEQAAELLSAVDLLIALILHIVGRTEWLSTNRLGVALKRTGRLEGGCRDTAETSGVQTLDDLRQYPDAKKTG